MDEWPCDLRQLSKRNSVAAWAQIIAKTKYRYKISNIRYFPVRHPISNSTWSTICALFFIFKIY